MFDFLKKKISGFVSGLSKKDEEEKPVVTKTVESIPTQKAAEETTTQSIPQTPKPDPESVSLPKQEHSEDFSQLIAKTPEEKPKEIIKPKVEPKTQEKPVQKPEVKKDTSRQEPAPTIVQKPIISPKPEVVVQEKQKAQIPSVPKPADVAKPAAIQKPVEVKPKPQMQKEDSDAKEKDRIKLGIVSSVKTFILGEIQITESDIKDMLDNLELELLEADVDMSVSQFIVERLRSKLLGAKVKRGSVSESINLAIKEILGEVLENEKSFDFIERIRSLPKPVKVIFVGINGAGKTTTIAKVIHLLQQNNLKVAVAAGDTFRAAAIEQLSTHTDRLGVRLIKRDYGSDPTSVAFDAVSYAKAHAIDVVLIDTAGRQDTNISLINEMKKMVRVISPDLKIYIGESVSGNAIVEQVSSFNREIGLDGIILTKIDCDPKGGTVLSINKTSGVPIVFLGLGQKYEDLEAFSVDKIVDRILS